MIRQTGCNNGSDMQNRHLTVIFTFHYEVLSKLWGIAAADHGHKIRSNPQSRPMYSDAGPCFPEPHPTVKLGFHHLLAMQLETARNHGVS